MTTRHLDVQIVVDCTKTSCGSCHFQHREWSGCILFGGALERVWEMVDGRQALRNKRLKECAVAEWKAKKNSKTKGDKIR